MTIHSIKLSWVNADNQTVTWSSGTHLKQIFKFKDSYTNHALVYQEITTLTEKQLLHKIEKLVKFIKVLEGSQYV